jgi:hypothetical protein
MTTSPESKVTARHLARAAYLYVRQSSLRQVLTPRAPPVSMPCVSAPSL